MPLSQNVTRALVAGAVTVAVCAPAVPAAAQTPGFHRVEYAGTSVLVPQSWPVIQLDKYPATCVRYDVHAVYLGAPGADQNCPAAIVGKTEAVLIEPAAATPTTGLDESAHEFDRVAGGVHVVASYGTDRTTAGNIMTSATPAAGTPGAPSPHASPLVAALPPSATNYTGKGFDPCTAPSPSTMSAWKASSPYSSVGVYIGGENRSCSQPNLTASNVANEVAAGWHFFLLYVGKQAPTTSCGCSTITSPTSDGRTEADDAAAKAAALGFGAGSPIIFDMESYQSSSTTTVLTFLSSWTSELHVKGYKSGVYSSSSSGINDLVTHYTSYTMPDIIDDALWNNQVNTNDSRVPANEWANHRRIHQYQGGHNETYGGVTINIDNDYLDVQLGAGSTATVGRQLADLNHDGYPELIGRNSAGALLAYPHLATPAIAGSSWGAAVTIGSGWNQFDQITFADLDGDGLPEIIARDPAAGNGTLKVYPHLAGVTTIAGTSWSAPVTIGSGWNTYDQTLIADLNGDGLPELVGRDASTGGGTLKAYPHVAGVTTIDGTSWTTPVSIGSGWNQYNMIALADLDHDGLPEIIGRDASLSDGTLNAYPHVPGVTTIADSSWSPPVSIGSGWNAYDTFSTGDLDKDGYPEIVARNPSVSNGALLAYPHLANTPAIAGSSWSQPVTIGSGWNTYTLLT
ncbi:MAG: hypothetical protein V7603_3348 [Micromonosporaceae bacterium]